MKKSLFLIPCLAAALWSCSDKDVVNNPGNGELADVNTSYLSISIISNTSGSTRGVEKDAENDKTNGTFVFGSSVENEVKSVRFYFFDANGNAATVRRDGKNYYDVPTDSLNIMTGTTGKTPNSSNTPNIERILNSTVVIESPAGDLVPASLIAIINGPANLKTDFATIDAINAWSANYRDIDNGFVMSNSVYANTYTDTKFVATTLSEGNFSPDVVTARKNPVNVYVERVLAKVSVDFDNIGEDDYILTSELEDINDAAGGKIFKVYDPDNTSNQLEIKNAANTTATQVYAKILGWNVTTRALESYLLKNINETWEASDVFSDWSYPDFRRSYWAINPNLKTKDFGYTDFNGSSNGTFESGKAISGISYTTFKGTLSGDTYLYDGEQNFTYVQENATGSNSANKDSRVIGGKTVTVNDFKTQVIVPCQLVDQSGNPLKMVEFMGFKYVGDSYQSDVKKAILNLLTNYYKKTGSGTSASYKNLTEADITLVSAKEYFDENNDYTESTQGSTPNYYVYAVLTTKANEEFSWVKLNEYNAGEESEKYVPVTDDELQGELDAMHPIKVWKDGYTYYYVDIKHLNNGTTGKGQYGVVRNHWYDILITKIYGFGTPVYEPSEEIIPETPEDVESYLAAKINILSWRLVQNEYELGK